MILPPMLSYTLWDIESTVRPADARYFGYFLCRMFHM